MGDSVTLLKSLWGESRKGGEGLGGREVASKKRETKAEREARGAKEALRAADRAQLESIGARIKQARLEHDKMTQRKLGDLLGITETMVSNIERGVYSPYRYITKLETIFRRDRQWFLHGDDGHDGDVTQMLREIVEKLDHLTALMEAKGR
jgi:Helix-turn-helix.